jgi:hypothetical protein
MLRKVYNFHKVMFMITIIEIDNDKGNRNIYFSKHFLQRNMFYLIGKEFTFN